jgi:hypothetical protein
VPAPVITGITGGAGSGARVEAGEDVAFTAAITDAESAGEAPTTYLWTATIGTITGSGATAVWRLPTGVITVGQNVVVSLTVVKPYRVLENNAIAPKEYRVTASAAAFRVHDSVAEIRRITLTFLIDYFGNPALGPDQCLVDFSTSCAGRQAEWEDIFNNRKDRLITSSQATVQSIAFNTSRTFANIVAPCTFRDIELATGRRYIATGTCLLTAVYEQQRWWLCDSNFQPGAGSGPESLGRGRGGRYWDYAVPDDEE